MSATPSVREAAVSLDDTVTVFADIELRLNRDPCVSEAVPSAKRRDCVSVGVICNPERDTMDPMLVI